MSQVLSQSEIEDLLAEIAAPPAPKSTADETGGIPGSINQSQGKVFIPLNKRRSRNTNSRSGPISYEIYDFRRPDKLSKDHLRTLQIIHESFARLFTSTISGYLRTTATVEMISTEQISYEEYSRSISGSLINVLNVSPLVGSALFEVDLRILFSMLDRLLGGRGEGGMKQGHDLTDIEKVLAESIVKRALTDLESSWETVQAVEFEIMSVETSAQYLQLVPNNDTVVLVLFEVRIGSKNGAMSLCIPFQLIKPILTKLNAQRWFTSGGKHGANLAPQVADRLRETTLVNCTARLGTTRLTLHEIAELQLGDVVPLSRPVAPMPGTVADRRQPLGRAEIVIGSSPKFRGKIGISEGRRLAVQVDEVVAPPPQLIVNKEIETNEQRS
jgi:flagellar motor switch protein FliM